MIQDKKQFIDNFLTVRDPVVGRVLFKLHQHQREMIDDMDRHSDIFFLQSRQVGVSSAILAYLICEVLDSNPNSLFLMFTPSVSLSAAHCTEFEQMFHNIPTTPIASIHCTSRNNNSHEVQFSNGTKVVFGVPYPSMLVGRTIDIIVLDNSDHMNQIEVENILTNGHHYHQLIMTGNSFPACCLNRPLYSRLITAQNNNTIARIQTSDPNQILIDNYDRAMSVV
jgi:hypothetical protein